jgi:hypothetical protein
MLRILEDWKWQGKLRRIGAIANHFKVRPGVEAMVVWQVVRRISRASGISNYRIPATEKEFKKVPLAYITQ